MTPMNNLKKTSKQQWASKNTQRFFSRMVIMFTSLFPFRVGISSSEGWAVRWERRCRRRLCWTCPPSRSQQKKYRGRPHRWQEGNTLVGTEHMSRWWDMDSFPGGYGYGITQVKKLVCIKFGILCKFLQYWHGCAGTRIGIFKIVLLGWGDRIVLGCFKGMSQWCWIEFYLFHLRWLIFHGCWWRTWTCMYLYTNKILVAKHPSCWSA